MDKKILMIKRFDDTENEKYRFHQNKSSISLNNIYIK